MLMNALFMRAAKDLVCPSMLDNAIVTNIYIQYIPNVQN